jgi:hypothetical protein
LLPRVFDDAGSFAEASTCGRAEALRR